LCPRQRLLSASGKSPPPRLASVSATPSVSSRLTHFPSSCVGPGASPDLGAASQATGPPPSPPESHRVVVAPVSFRLDIVPLPRSISRANTLPRCHAVAMDVPRGHLPVDQPTVARLRPRCVARSAPHHRARAGTACALRAMWAATWVVHTLCYGPHPVVSTPRRPRTLCV
jgi:hypothetical protein